MDFLTYVWIFFSYFGDIAYWLGFTISFLLIYPFLEKRDKEKQKWILYYLLPSVLLSYLSAFILKLIFHIPRICSGLKYCPSTYTFPSGHATIAFAFFVVMFLHFKKSFKIRLLSFLLATLVCISRVALKVHTIYDIFGGILVGTSVALSWNFIFSRIEKEKGKEHFYFRKFIHLSSISIVILTFFVSKIYLFVLTFSLTLLFLISEIFRIKKIYFPIIQEISLYCKKKEEKSFLFEPFLFGFSLAILLLLPKNILLASSIPLIIGDSFAGIIGYKYGKHKIFYNRRKSLEGSLAFFISTFFTLLFFFDLKISLLLSLFSTVIESLLKKFENLLLPFFTSLFYVLITL
ncbi:MAG: phosphatase PAP2 family protein [Candidatus Aenigmatarchaeota archaeon]